MRLGLPRGLCTERMQTFLWSLFPKQDTTTIYTVKSHSHCIRYPIIRNLGQPEDIPEVSTTAIPVNNVYGR